MKTLICLFMLSFFSESNSPKGMWVHKEDASRIEIYGDHGKFSGKLVSSRHPFLEPGIEVLKDLEFKKGKWQGKVYISKKKRWVDATLMHKGDLLFIEMDLGYEIRKIHWYRA